MSNTAMYFVAIVLPEPVRSDLLAIKEEFRDRFGCTVALKSPAHITLWPPMNLPAEAVQGMETAIDTVSREQFSFSVTLKNFDAFPPRVIFVAIEKNPLLEDLQLRLSDAICETVPALEQKRDRRPFHPHATVANRDLQQADFETAWQEFSQRAYSAQIEAKGITLLRHNGAGWDEWKYFPFRD